MESLLVSPFTLALIFFVIAFLYSAVGLGGGSSYTALLAIFGASPLAIPSISLTLNTIVTSIGSVNYLRRGHARWHLILPFLVGSIPLAYVGGTLVLPREIFYWVLLISLLVVVIRIYSPRATSLGLSFTAPQRIIVSLMSGALLGFVAGAVGIGGGIYLVPLIILLGLGTPKEAAAAGAIFIWANSSIGLVARYMSDRLQLDYSVWIIGAVIVGGLLGSSLGAGRFSARTMEKLLGVILVIAIVLLMKKIFVV